MKKRGIFFSIDALLSFTIILMIILIAFPLVKMNKYESPIARDILVTLSSLKMGEITDPYIMQLIVSGTLDPNKTALEQIGMLTITNETLAKNLTTILLENIETNENIGIWYGNKLIYSHNKTAYENASNVFTERYIVSGLGGLGNETLGYSARAFLSSAYLTAYSYFGGYVGDGNISKLINYQGNISSAEIELAINNNFTLYINGINSGNYSKSPSDTEPARYSLENYINNFMSGANTLEFRGFNLYIAGGYVKITYQTNASNNQETKKYIPGINGLVNLYDGLSVNGQLNSMDIFLHYKIPYESFLIIGNTTIWNGSSSAENTTSITNAQISSLLNYNQLSNTTTPIRFGSQNVSFISNNTGNADVILITDVSGSMNWRMNADASGTERNCTDPLTFSDSSTRRISVARCLDLQFVSTILQSNNNRVGLVSLGDSSNSYVNLTNNATLLNNTINNYAAGQMTCISCAINRAYLMLQENSNSSRQKYVITMTDGVANIRSAPQCYNINDASITNISSTTAFAVGESGAITAYSNSQWMSIKNASTSNLNGIDLLNDTYGFAVGDSYRLFRWNGTSWSLQQDLGNNVDLYGISLFNRTLGFAVGDTGKIAKWDGTSWAEYQDIGNNNFKDIKLLNATLGFAIANSGKIFRWNGSSTNWYEYQDLGNDNLKSIDMFNETYGIIASDSREIFSWNGVSWSSQQTLDVGISPADVDIYNSTLAFISTSNGLIYKKIGNNAWAQESYASTNSYINTIRIINDTFGFAIGNSIGGLILWNGTSWNNTYPGYYYQGNSTNGISCNDPTSCALLQNIATLNANYSSCRINQEQNATVHSIGFGPVTTCALSARTLLSIAACGNGSYYASDNATQLQQIYENISQSIVQLSYAQQTATTIGNATGILYPDSYINLNYTTVKNPFGLIISLEKQFQNTTQGNFSTYPNSTILDAQVTSYSGPRWTDKLKLNENLIYNISKYELSYILLGDPYSILIPPSLALNQNNVTLTTGVAPTNISVGSESNKIIYTLAKNFSSFSPISATAQGCQWNIRFEDNSSLVARIPSTYIGSNQCYFPPNGGFTHDPNDAFQVAVYNILRQLDLNGNQMIDPRLTEQALQIDASQVNGIPYTWYTEVQIRTWT